MKLKALAALAALALPAAALAQDDRPAWWLNGGGDAAMLGYSIPESDDAGPMLTCDRSTRNPETAGKVSVTIFVDHRIAARLAGENWVDGRGRPAPWAAMIKITAAGVVAEYPALAHPDEMNGGSQITALVPVGAPVLAEFARTGRIRFESFGEIDNPPIAPVAKVAGLMRVCRK